MEMNVRFDSVEELQKFIGLFKNPMKAVETIVTTKEEVKPVEEPVKETKSADPKPQAKKEEKTVKKEDKPKQEEPKEESKPVEEPKKEDKPKVTKVLLRQNLKKLASVKGNQVAMDVVKEFGASKLPEVQEKDFEALNNRMLELIRE